MAERTEIEKLVRWLIASDIVYRPLKSLGEKGVRRLDKTAGSIADLVQKKSEVGERVIARIEEKSEDEKARTVNEGIKEFRKKYPKYGDILKDIIDEKRSNRNKYLIYGLKQEYKLGEDDYLKVMEDLGFEKREASSMYPHIVSISERLKKANVYEERSILLKKQPSKKKKKD